MAESHVISGLVSKRAELSGLFQQHQAELRQIAIDLAHIDGAIKLFDPDYNLNAIKAKVTKPLNPWFDHGEASRLILDVLRSSSTPLYPQGMISTRQIGEAMVSIKGLVVESPKEWDLLLKLVLSSARRLAKKGIIQAQGRTQGANSSILWQIV
jgi:hypothetical protein